MTTLTLFYVYNREETLKEELAGLEGDYIHILNDASTDNSLPILEEWLKKQSGHVKLSSMFIHEGEANCINYALRETHGKDLVVKIHTC